MKITDLQKAVQEVDFNEEKQVEMIRALKEGKRRGGQAGVLRVAASFAVCVLAVGALSVPVRALVNSLVQERMEQLPEEEIVSVREQIYSQQTEADSKTREYSAGEKERRGKLYAQYLAGLFPTGELVQVNSEEEAAGYDFCFLTTTGVFYLPANRELTDEEILEQIDFEKKRDYALQEQNAEEIAKKEAEEREQVKEVVASGGINEEQAVEIATGYLQQIYGLDGSGMEINHYYISEDDFRPVYPNSYCVNWSDIGNHRYFYFHIDAADGTLRSLSYSHDMKERLANRPAVTEAADQTPSVSEQAKRFLTEKLEIQENYEEIRSYYLVNTESEKVSGSVDVLFVMADGTARQTTCTWDGEVFDYSVTTQDDYEESLQSTAYWMGKEYERDHGYEVEYRIESVVN